MNVRNALNPVHRGITGQALQACGTRSKRQRGARRLRDARSARVVVVLVLASVFTAAAAAGVPLPSQSGQGPETDARVNGFPQAWSGSQRCGTYLVEWSTPRSTGNATLTVRDEEGSVVVDAAEPVEACCERITPFWCGEALDDRSMVLSYAYYTGGAHCCTTMHVVDLEGPTTLLRAELGNYNDAVVATQLDDGSSLELFGLSDVFAYFDDLSFAGSPWLPIVFAYRNGAYREVTRDYDRVVRADLAGALAELRARLQDPTYPADAKALVLQAFGDYVLLGEATPGLERLKREVGTESDLSVWLDAHVDEAKRVVAERFNGVG